MQSLQENEKTQKQKFRCWLEEWEKPLLKKNDCVVEVSFLNKYKDVVFRDIDTDTFIAIDNEGLYFECGRKGGWTVLGNLPDYDGNRENLDPWSINEDTLIYLIQQT